MGGFKNCFMAYFEKQIKDLEICQKSVKSIIVVYCETKKHKKKSLLHNIFRRQKNEPQFIWNVTPQI